MRQRLSGDHTDYLFMDAGYIRKLFEKWILPLDDNLIFFPAGLTENTSTPLSKRVFYYDCMDPSLPHDVETRRLDRIRALPNYHVREGVITGRDRRQKKIDVMLAVDALEFATRGVCEEITLLAGDQDFVPLVEALIRVGTIVTVCASSQSLSPALRHAADRYEELDYGIMMEWTDWSAAPSVRPYHHRLSPEEDCDGTVYASGHCARGPLSLLRRNDCGHYAVAFLQSRDSNRKVDMYLSSSPKAAMHSASFYTSNVVWDKKPSQL